MIIGIGIDLVELSRFQKALVRHKRSFLQKIFTARERKAAPRMPKRTLEYYAARFAAKEATLKALGTGLRKNMSWRDIEIRRNAQGRPSLVLKGYLRKLARQKKARKWLVSLTHIAYGAMAVVLAES